MRAGGLCAITYNVRYAARAASKAVAIRKGALKSPQLCRIRCSRMRLVLSGPLAYPRGVGHSGGSDPTDNPEEGKSMDVEAKVKEIIVQQLGVDAEKVTPEASFVDDLGADSLDVVELVMAFEEEFGVEIPDEAAEKIATVKNATEFLKQSQAG